LILRYFREGGDEKRGKAMGKGRRFKGREGFSSSFGEDVNSWDWKKKRKKSILFFISVEKPGGGLSLLIQHQTVCVGTVLGGHLYLFHSVLKATIFPSSEMKILKSSLRFFQIWRRQ
jgi:hypothetical protein